MTAAVVVVVGSKEKVEVLFYFSCRLRYFEEDADGSYPLNPSSA
jgi:hypothetical protein